MASSSSSSSSSGSVGGETRILTSASVDPSETLIPGLPDDLAAVILALLPFADQSRLRTTARSWRTLLAPRVILPLRFRLRLPCRNLLALFPADPALSPPCLFDPVAGAWAPLPPIPCSPHAYGLSNFVPVALGRHIYVLGGSQFDTRSFPLDHPTASAAAYRLDLAGPRPLAWRRLPDMLSPRGSFACATLQPRGAAGKGGSSSGIIMVAGGGSRHSMFPSEGSRMSSVEYYDVDAGHWRMGKGLPTYRAGCFGFFISQDAGEDEFWVMGGYGEYETVASVVPSDVYYRNALVLGLESGKWKDVGDMWDEGERMKLGAAVAVQGEDGKVNGVFMLKSNDIFRYDFNANRWLKESSLRKKVPPSGTCGFAAVNGELFVLTTAMPSPHAPDARKAVKRRATLEIQVYNPGHRRWRLLATSPPYQQHIDFKVATACTIQL